MAITPKHSAEIREKAMRHRRQKALIAEMATVKPVEDRTWNFGLTPAQLDDFLKSVNAEIDAEDQSINEGPGTGDDG